MIGKDGLQELQQLWTFFDGVCYLHRSQQV
jgi:hypothetical protein